MTPASPLEYRVSPVRRGPAIGCLIRHHLFIIPRLLGILPMRLVPRIHDFLPVIAVDYFLALILIHDLVSVFFRTVVYTTGIHAIGGFFGTSVRLR
ncbi:MAG: hypothetical protein DRI34_13770, partial [Deltaproteobacteria bacterium]